MVDAPYKYLDDTGVIVADTSDLQTEVQTEFKEAFDADLSTAPETGQGVLMVAETNARADVVRGNAALANQINPNIAGGVFLKAICALTGLDDPGATFSTISPDDIVLTGEPHAIIPVGAQAYTAAKDYFQTVEAVELDDDGNGRVGFQALVAGPVPCDVGALQFIGTDVLGWETVSNIGAATVGLAELSDDALRRKRNGTLAGQGRTLAEAVQAALVVLPGYRSHKFRENKKAGTQTIDGIELVGKSVWACVEGGTDADIAFALLQSVSAGADYNGDVDITVTDPSSGQEYDVLFDRPTAVPVLVKVTFTAPAAAVTPASTVVQAVLDYAAGLIANQPGFVVGGDVSPFEIAGAVMSELPGVFVRKVEVALKSDGIFQTTELELELNELATVLQADISTVVV